MVKEERIQRREDKKEARIQRRADKRDENIRNPGCNSFKKICYPKALFDTILAVIFPPLYVILHEYRKTPKFKDMSNIIQNIILTSMFYVPGLMHAMFLLNND
tara:strand:- start:76 stop:384 length:309 start_codon:yes stop_codon:yes gene_type:complete